MNRHHTHTPLSGPAVTVPEAPSFSRLSPKEHMRVKSRTIAAYSGRETPDLEIRVNETVKTLLEKIEKGYVNHSDAPPTLRLMIDVIARLTFGEAFSYLS